MENTVSFIEHVSDSGLLDAYSKTITGVVSNISQAVVHIQVQKKSINRRTRVERMHEGTGSGFIISSDGYIVTNNHVIDNAIDINVNFSDCRILKAELKGSNSSTDIAL